MTKLRTASGSSGTENAFVVMSAINKWYLEIDPLNRSSANFQDYWNNRATRVPDPRQLDYIIGAHNSRTPVQTAAGWYQYHRDLRLSTHNTSSGASQLRTLPDHGWRVFVTALAAISTNGVSDAGLGRSVYALWNTTGVTIGGELTRFPFQGGSGFELLCAWAGRGTNSSAGAGSSAQL